MVLRGLGRLFRDMVFGQRHAAQVIGKATAKVLEVRASQHAASLHFTGLNPAIKFTGRQTYILDVIMVLELAGFPANIRGTMR